MTLKECYFCTFATTVNYDRKNVNKLVRAVVERDRGRCENNESNVILMIEPWPSQINLASMIFGTPKL